MPQSQTCFEFIWAHLTWWWLHWVEKNLLHNQMAQTVTNTTTTATIAVIIKGCSCSDFGLYSSLKKPGETWMDISEDSNPNSLIIWGWISPNVTLHSHKASVFVETLLLLTWLLPLHTTNPFPAVMLMLTSPRELWDTLQSSSSQTANAQLPQMEQLTMMLHNSADRLKCLAVTLMIGLGTASAHGDESKALDGLLAPSGGRCFVPVDCCMCSRYSTVSGNHQLFWRSKVLMMFHIFFVERTQQEIQQKCLQNFTKNTITGRKVPHLELCWKPWTFLE